MSCKWLFVPLLLATGVVLADDVPETEPVAGATEAQAQPEEGAEPAAGATEPQAQPKEGPKEISGMSILGNQEAPKSLIIVPWKTSELGDTLGISTMLDDSKQPVDREVFMRALSYYEIRSEETTP
jgi:hypothetical protein